MEPTEKTQNKSASPNKGIIAIIALLIVLIIVALGAVFLLRDNQKDDSNLSIGYATDASVMLDQNSLQAAMDEAAENAAKGNIGLYYVNDAYSTDGLHFECMIGNSSSNLYDMYLQIFADEAMQDQIFLSGLVPPGSGFENITLDHALDPGVHTVYVALTQVDTDEETGEQVLKNQVMHTMDFHVYG